MMTMMIKAPSPIWEYERNTSQHFTKMYYFPLPCIIPEFGFHSLFNSFNKYLLLSSNDLILYTQKYSNISLNDHPKYILVEGLTPWTLYNVCLQVQIVSKLVHETTAFSPSKCFVVRTKQAGKKLLK